jgi:hypothetical protein
MRPAPTHNDAQVAALALTLAERWPLINAVGEDERNRIRESLRRLRLATLASRVQEVSPDPEPRTIPGGSDLGGKRPPRTTTPTREGSLGETLLAGERVDVPRELANEAGLISRGAYRGVRGDARYRHDDSCPWARGLWPMTPNGDVILCSCGVADRLEGPIAAKVNGQIWAHWARLEQREADKFRHEWWSWSSDKRRAFTRSMKRGGKAVPAWMIAKAQAEASPEPPSAEDWDTILARLRESLR